MGNYCVCWEEDIYQNVIGHYTNFGYVDDYEGRHYFITAENRRDAAEVFLKRMYKDELKYLPEKIFKEDFFEEFVKCMIDEVTEEMFEGYSRKDELYALSVNIFDEYINVLKEKGVLRVYEENNSQFYSVPNGVCFLEEILSRFTEDHLFSLLTQADEERMWMKFKMNKVAVIDLWEL